jgi:predicted transcriptional regulator
MTGKNMKYRSRTDIVSQILDAANGGSTKTRIMYKAYLSYAQLKEYLSILVENGLLEYQDAEEKYRTTEKGMKFIKAYHHMDSLTGSMVQEAAEK